MDGEIPLYYEYFLKKHSQKLPMPFWSFFLSPKWENQGLSQKNIRHQYWGMVEISGCQKPGGSSLIGSPSLR